MLRIYDDVVSVQADLRAVFERIRVHDADLARQLRRAAQSVALNLSEGMAARDGRRRVAYERALQEAQECVGNLEIAMQWGYTGHDASLADRLDKIVATLNRLVRLRG